jgi:hypothetical protein
MVYETVQFHSTGNQEFSKFIRRTIWIPLRSAFIPREISASSGSARRRRYGSRWLLRV